MRALGVIAVCLAAVIGGAVAWCQINYPTYTYRYRLTLALEVDGKLHTGSSVIEISWVGQPYIPGAGSFVPRVRGQAAFIDFGSRGVVVAALVTGETSQDVPDGSKSAVWIAARAFGNESTQAELAELPRLTGRRQLMPDNMPRLIWFPDAADPKTARRFAPQNLRELFDPSGRLDAYIEITRDPIIIDIDKKLPWFNMLSGASPNFGVIYLPSGFALSREMFIGDSS